MAEDQFERYYAEKLWETIPAIYRHEDGIAEEPGVLRAMVQVIASQAAILRRSQDRLWDDQFIELCDEWAVPYIGDLVGTRLLSALNKRGRRIDVAKTIYYRRRKGTPRILEELIHDISGWDGKLVEQFQRLGRARHGLDPAPKTLAGRFSGTLPGGWADLRNQRISELTNGPFEEYFHTPDFRRHCGLNGRYNIPKLAFYLFRLRAFPVIKSTPFAVDGLSFTFDPSGRDIPLFSKRLRHNDWDEWRTAYEWELPAPIPCRLLGHAEYRVDEEVIQRLLENGLSDAAADKLRQISGLRFRNEKCMVTILSSFDLSPEDVSLILAFSLVPDCGKQALLPDTKTIKSSSLETSSIVVGFELEGVDDKIISVEKTTSANLNFWSVGTNKDLAIDAENGRFQLSDPIEDQTVYVSYHYGFSGPIGAGTYDRPWIKMSDPYHPISGGVEISSESFLEEGIIQIEDSKTYLLTVLEELIVIHLTVQSANFQRPYLQLVNNWIVNSNPHLNSILTLDGLWIGSAGDTNATIIIRGIYECVVIKNCTLDPGGSTNANGETLNPLAIIVEGFVENLCIESCILGPVRLEGAGSVEEIFISDSIIQAVYPDEMALEIDKGKVHIVRTTILGNVQLNRLEASETLITGLASVRDTQNGCFRFSAAPAQSRLPRPYESFLYEKDANHWFTSRLFGDPGYAQLSDTAPKALVRGAENGSEIGAFSNLLNPIKLDGLIAKIGEYMPFGLIPIFINKT